MTENYTVGRIIDLIDGLGPEAKEEIGRKAFETKGGSMQLLEFASWAYRRDTSEGKAKTDSQKVERPARWYDCFLRCI
ncbi:MAG: hypothetical protein HY513_05195 [Candidatus Aenigmarchaeota archaeon]|nr:hypothetical protein [Candidatus Aenigmarchaeota archaeon]